MSNQTLLFLAGTVFGCTIQLFLLCLLGARTPLSTALAYDSIMTPTGPSVSDIVSSILCVSVTAWALATYCRAWVERLLTELSLWSETLRQDFLLWSALVRKWVDLGLSTRRRLLFAIFDHCSRLIRACITATLNGADHIFALSPKPDTKNYELQDELADMRRVLAVSERARSSAQTHFQTSQQDLQAAKQKILEYEFELENVKNDTVATRTRHERAALNREIQAIAEQLIVEEEGRRKAEWWAEHHHDMKLKVDDELRGAEDIIKGLREELNGSKQAVLELHEKCRYYFSRYRDATQFDLVKKVLHKYAETRGDEMTVAVAFAHAYKEHGGSLPSLGVDADRFQALRYFVANGQNPALAIQPIGFAFQ